MNDAQVLARNDRFLVEIVEALVLCPFARGTRTSGELAREVVDEAGVLEAIRRHDDSHAQIVLLIVPRFAGDAKAFARLVDDVRKADQEARSPIFALAPFHPETTYSIESPSKLVGLFRRSPDPTIQLVRFSAIESAKSRAPDGKFFFDGTPASWARLAARPERGLSEQITFDNWTRMKDRAAQLAEKLAALR